MICRACGIIVPPEFIACPGCVAKSSRRALLAYQAERLRQVAAGTAALTTRAIRGVRHVQMFGAEEAFCGLPIPAPAKRNRFVWEVDNPNLLCSSCRAQIEVLIREMTA